MNESQEQEAPQVALKIGIDMAQGDDAQRTTEVAGTGQRTFMSVDKTAEYNEALRTMDLTSSEPKKDNDLPPVDVVDLDTEEIDLEKVGRELDKAENELMRLVMDKCPTCGEKLTYIKEEPYCLPCIRRKMGSRTVSNSIKKVENLITIYKTCMLKHKRPSVSIEMFSTLIPRCLLNVNMEAEILLIQKQDSVLSVSQRKFITLFEELKQLYFAAILDADMYEKSLADAKVVIAPEPSPFAKEEQKQE